MQTRLHIDVEQWIHLRAAVRVLVQHVARLDPSAAGRDILARSATFCKGGWEGVLDNPFLEPVSRLLDQYAQILRMSLLPSILAPGRGFVERRKLMAIEQISEMLQERPRKGSDEILSRFRDKLAVIDQYDENLIPFEKRMLDNDQIHFKSAIDFLNIFVPAMQSLLKIKRFDVMQLIAYRVIFSEIPANPKDSPIPQYTKDDLSKIFDDRKKLVVDHSPWNLNTPFCFRILFYSRAMQLGDQIRPLNRDTSFENVNDDDREAITFLNDVDHKSIMFLISAFHNIPGRPDLASSWETMDGWLNAFRPHKGSEEMALNLAFDLQRDAEIAKTFGRNTDIAVSLLKQMNLPDYISKQTGNWFLVELIRYVIDEEIKTMNPHSSPPESPSPESQRPSKTNRFLRKIGIKKAPVTETPVTPPTAKWLADTILWRFTEHR